MAWPKGKKRTQEKEDEKIDEPEVSFPEYVAESVDEAAASITTIDESAPVKYAEQNCIMYHREHEPRKFLKGDLIGDGWEGPQGILGVFWTMDDDGKWVKLT